MHNSLQLSLFKKSIEEGENTVVASVERNSTCNISLKTQSPCPLCPCGEKVFNHGAHGVHGGATVMQNFLNLEMQRTPPIIPIFPPQVH